MKIKLYHRAAVSHFVELKLENGCNKYHKEGFSIKVEDAKATYGDKLFRVHSQPHGPHSPAKSNTHFHCQTQICTLSHTHKHRHIVYLDTTDTEGYSQYRA